MYARIIAFFLFEREVNIKWKELVLGVKIWTKQNIKLIEHSNVIP